MVSDGKRGRTKRGITALVLMGLGFVEGCMSSPDARYVYQDGEFGVIGIPRNSPYGIKKYDVQARELMTRHFPDGFEVVRAEEVVEGERILDTAIKKELETEPGLNAFNQMIKIGKLVRSSSLAEKDTTHITESRIIYRRKRDGKATGADGFASVANQAPSLYLDPDEITRKVDEEALLMAKKLEGGKDPRKEKSSEGKLEEKKTLTADVKVKDDNVSKASATVPSNP